MRASFVKVRKAAKSLTVLKADALAALQEFKFLRKSRQQGTSFVAHAVEVVRRNRRPLGHGAVRGGGGHAVAVADDRPLVLRHVVDRELQRDGAEGTEEK